MPTSPGDAEPVPTAGLGRRATRAVLWRGLDLGATRLISLVRFLVLARLLDPADFGLLAIAAAALELLLTLTEVGVTRALVQRRGAGRDDYDVAWTIGLVRSAFVLVVLVVAAPELSGLLGDERATGILRILALQPLLASLESIGVVRLTRDLRFSAIARLDIGASAAEAAVAMALAPLLGVEALVLAALLSSAGRSGLSYAVAPHRPRLRWDRRAATELMGFGKWVFLGLTFSVAGDLLLRAAVGRQLGAGDLGLFYLGARLAYLPNQIAAELVTPVAFSVHARLQSAGDLAARAFLTGVSGMVALLVPVTGVLVALSGPLVEHVLGDDWEGAAPVLAVLALVGVVTIPVDAAEPMFEGRGRPDVVAWLRGARAAGVLALAWWLTGAAGLAGAAVAALAAEVLIAAAAAWLTRGTWWAARAAVGRTFASGIAAGAGAGAASLVVASVIPGAAGVVLAAAVGVAAGSAALGLLDRPLRLRIRSLVELARRSGSEDPPVLRGAGAARPA